MAPEERGRATSTKTEESTGSGCGGDDDGGGDGIIDEEEGVRPGVGQLKKRRLVVVLTLARHVDGVWITRLMSELRRRFSDLRNNDEEGGTDGCSSYQPVVVTLEELFQPSLGSFNLGVDGIPDEWSCVVNRVSDAATPSEVKSFLAVLRMVEIWGLGVYNGPTAYSIGCSKMLHHHVFARAGLTTPRSVPVRLNDRKESAEEELIRASKLLLEEKGATCPFLVKPNSAGFGAGIELFHSADDLAAYGRRIDAEKYENHGAVGGGTAGGGAVVGPSNDGMALLQEYLKPSGGCVYRVWFLDGHVQCATRREVDVVDEDGSEASNKDRLFTGGCAGGVCALPPRTSRVTHGKQSGDDVSTEKNRFRQRTDHDTTRTTRVWAWSVPPEVEDEIGDILKVVGDDCHAGSVEFLFDSNNDRVYFDLNMLSTLPMHDDGSVGASDQVWKESFDPWAELADSIARMVLDGDGGR